MATSSNRNGTRTGLYVLGGSVGLGAAYYVGCFLGANLFLGLDWSAYGELGGGGWPGWALLGLGLGMAAGTWAAQRRYRLSRALPGGAAGLALALVATAALTSRGRLPDAGAEAGAYESAPRRGQCPACAAAEASSTRADAQNRYAASRLLDKDPTTAWIAADGETTGSTLRLRLRLPADQQLVGLRLTNGYAKSREVYRSFARVRAGRVSLDGGPETAFTLPDAPEPDRFIPLRPPPGRPPADIVVRLTDTYPGTNHAEPALSGLVPVIAPVK